MAHKHQSSNNYKTLGGRRLVICFHQDVSSICSTQHNINSFNIQQQETYLGDELGGVKAGVVGDNGGQLAQGSGEGLHRQSSLTGRSGDLPGVQKKRDALQKVKERLGAPQLLWATSYTTAEGEIFCQTTHNICTHNEEPTHNMHIHTY